MDLEHRIGISMIYLFWVFENVCYRSDLSIKSVPSFHLYPGSSEDKMLG